MPPNEAEMIHFVVGTRAQLFKLAPVMLECEERDLDWRWVYTAQHRDTIERTAELFRLPPPDHVVVGWKTEAKSMGRMGLWFARRLTSLLRSREILGGNDRTSASERSFPTVLLAHGPEVRHPRLPPTRLLLHGRARHLADRVRAGRVIGRRALHRRSSQAGNGDPRCDVAHLRGPVHAVRHVVRHGKQQGASLSRAALTKASGFEGVDDHGRR